MEMLLYNPYLYKLSEIIELLKIYLEYLIIIIIIIIVDTMVIRNTPKYSCIVILTITNILYSRLWPSY